ncbi:CbtA family protein [Amaricoccus sp.]|uniref:CbtA family protein n=1 Tax=Amaricoccus sp. TaxID=1872485 RepID=UPI0026301FC1|nr:CbtA family protein [uncultured Amaricoccus sp.]
MNVLRNMFFVAALAGLAAGVVMTILQFFATVPLILEAETFENAAPAAIEAHDHAATPADGAAMTAMTAAHAHEDEEWAPADGFQRMGLTAVANIVTAIGFGLLLVAASEFAGGIASPRQGVLWGLAGFAVFTLAPGLGLPPELPAMPAADLAARQIWWFACVALTAGGLGLIAFGRSDWLALLGAALLVLPHLIGAPQPDSHASPIPENLHHSFVVAVTVTNLVFWVLLGAAVSLVRRRFATELGGARAQIA